MEKEVVTFEKKYWPSEFVHFSVSQADQEHQKLSFKELLLLNKPDWPLILIGVASSATIGIVFPATAPFFSEALRVSESAHKPAKFSLGTLKGRQKERKNTSGVGFLLQKKFNLFCLHDKHRLG